MKKSIFLSTLLTAAALSVPAFATDYDFTDNTSFTLDPSSYTSEDKLTFGDSSGSFVNGGTFAANIVINSGTDSGGLTIGGTAGTYTFSGTISGTGDWTTTVAHNYIFTGDVSGYTGTLIGSGTATFEYADTGTHTINANLNIEKMVFEGTANYVVNGTVIGYLHSGTSGNTITISTTGSVTFNTTTTITEIGIFTVNEGSTVIFGDSVQVNLTANGNGMYVYGTLEIAAGKTLTINKYAAATVSVANLKLDNGSNFTIEDAGANTITLSSVTVADNGTAKIAVGVSGANNSQDKVAISSLTGTNATLTLDSAAQTNNASIFELGGNNTSTTFTGKITLTDDATGTQRGMTLVISNAYIAAGAVIEMGTESDSTDALALGVNADRVEIAGLVSSAGHTGADIVYSGTVSLGSALGSGGSNLINGTLSTMNTSRNTLAINTATGQSYEFNGTVLTMLNLEKSGAGTQTINFASNSSFDGSINVKAGELALGGEAISSTGLTVAADATLNIANHITLAATSDITSVSSTISGTLSIESGGQLDLTGTVTINSAISNSGTITIADGTSFVIDSLTKGTNGSNDYYVLITGNSGTVSADGITIDNFTLTDGDLSNWSVYTDNGYLVIYGEASTTAQTADNLTWAGTEANHTWNTNSENAIWNDTDTGTSGYYFTDGNNVTFGAEGANTNVAVDGTVTAGSTTINGAYTFNIGEDASVTTGALTYGEGGSLTLTGSGTIVTGPGADSVFVINASDFTGTLEITSGRFDLVNSTVNGSATLVFDANGSVDSTGVYTDSTSIHYGKTAGTDSSPASYTLANNIVISGESGGVIIRSGNAYTTITFSGSVTGDTGTTLQLNGNGSAVFTGSVNVGTYINYQGATTFSGKTTLGELSIYQTATDKGDVTFTGSDAQATVTDLTIHSTTGTGTATLTVEKGANLTVANLVVNHDVAIAIDNGALAITTSATQGSSGSTSVTISNGGTLSLGSDVSLNVAAMEIVLGTDTYTNGTYAITGESSSSLTLTDDAAIKITVDSALASLLETDGTYSFNIYEGLSLDENVFDISDILNYAGVYEATWNQGVLTVFVGAIPEPELFSVFFGLGAIGLVATRRRKRA